MPCALRQFVVPVIADHFLHEISDVWGQVGFDLTFNAARPVALQNMYVRTIKPQDILGTRDAIKLWDTINFSREEDSIRHGSAEWTLGTDTSVSGFCMFWEADLVPGVTLSTSPHSPATHWEQIYVPVPRAVDLQKDDQLSLVLKSDTRFETGVNLQWKVTSKRGGKILMQEEMDMQKGFLA